MRPIGGESRKKQLETWMDEAGITQCPNCGHPIFSHKTTTCDNCGWCLSCGENQHG